MVLLGVLDFLFVNHACHSIITRGASVQLVFGFEVMVGCDLSFFFVCLFFNKLVQFHLKELYYTVTPLEIQVYHTIFKCMF